MYQASFDGYEIEITHDYDYVMGSADNVNKYDLVYYHTKDVEYSPTSRYGIKIYNVDIGIYKTALIMATGGATSVYSDSAIVHRGDLVINCCNKIFSLQLPDLQLNWIIEGDLVTCFSIHQYEDSYIVHGELSIRRISRKGETIWQVGASDIFVNIDHIGPTFHMHEEHIELMDWNGVRYKLFYDGEMIEDGMAERLK